VILVVDNPLLFILQHSGINTVEMDNLFSLLKRNLIEIRQVLNILTDGQKDSRNGDAYK
jgi:hypothetical protein